MSERYWRSPAVNETINSRLDGKPKRRLLGSTVGYIRQQRVLGNAFFRQFHSTTGAHFS
jgi:hypothetical protein